MARNVNWTHKENGKDLMRAEYFNDAFASIQEMFDELPEGKTTVLPNGVELRADENNIAVYWNGKYQGDLLREENGKLYVIADYAGRDSEGNVIHEHYATKDELKNAGGGGGSSSGTIVFSNGVQLRVGETEEGEVIEFYNTDTGESFPLFVVSDGTIYATIADEAFYAQCDEEGNFFTEHYATKEEVGNTETALDNIIAEQEAIIAIQNSLIGGDNS